MPRNGKIPQQGCPSGRPEFALFGSNSLEIPQQGSLPGHTPQTRIPPKYPSRGACSGRLRTRIRRQRPLPGRIPPFEAEFPKYPSRGPFPGEFPDPNRHLLRPNSTPTSLPSVPRKYPSAALPSRVGRIPQQTAPAGPAGTRNTPATDPLRGSFAGPIRLGSARLPGKMPKKRGRYKKFAWEKVRFAWELPGIPGKFATFPGNCLGFAWEMPGPRQICLGNAWERTREGVFRANRGTFAWKVDEFAWAGVAKGREKSQPEKVLYLWGQKKFAAGDRSRTRRKPNGRLTWPNRVSAPQAQALRQEAAALRGPRSNAPILNPTSCCIDIPVIALRYQGRGNRPNRAAAPFDGPTQRALARRLR